MLLKNIRIKKGGMRLILLMQRAKCCVIILKMYALFVCILSLIIAAYIAARGGNI